MAGAYDDGGFTRAKSAAETAGIPTSAPAPSIRESFAKAEAALDIASTNLDKVFANPKASNKAIDRAMTQYLNASNKANDLRGQLANSSSGSSGPSINYSEPEYVPSTVDAEPITPAAIPFSTPTIIAPVVAPPVKTAPIDTLLFDQESVSTDALVNLIFENIGGQELINITRNDIVNGQEVVYQPIKNLSSIQQQYNPNNILSLQSTSDKYFANFSIKLENRIPNPGTGPNGSYVYLDNNTGNLIIEAVNLELDEQIEAEITVSGTIYEAEFGESAS